MPRVLIIQAQMKHYRIPFFRRLFEMLSQDGIELSVAYSDPHGVHAILNDSGQLPSEIGRKVKGHWLAGKIIYQPLWREIAEADLVITGHENKYLMNIWLFLLSVLRLKTVALWGLGPCMEEGQSRISHWLREKAPNAVDWYFAYTDGIVPYVKEHGVAADRITSVQNAVDTDELRKSVAAIGEDEVSQARLKIGVAAGPAGIYCGVLEPTKHLPFLLESARLIRQQVSDFQLLIVGTGPDRCWVEKMANENPWIHYLGPKFGHEKALALRMADIFMLPGRVGLAVLDSFAAGLPLFTTELTIHCPEVAYLADGYNGRRTANEPQSYADAVVETLNSRPLLENMRQNALLTASNYTIEDMAANFKRGIRQCLALRGSTRQIAPAVPQ